MSHILITGGTGSFGKTVVKRLLTRSDTTKITVFSRDEDKQHHMRQEFNDPRLHFVIGDVRDLESIRLAARGADTLFHAAALKHVPTGEFYPMEVVRTNILGTQNVLTAAAANNIKKMVLLSTDKAVYPVNAMGISKAMAEKVLLAHAKAYPENTYCIVRYGNVMASRGSVIPLFIKQIKEGKDITITNPLMTRFLLSLEQAVDLVEFAIDKGESGDLFIKKAPAATIEVLAQALLELFGSSQRIATIGTREGEKVHETLATEQELAHAQEFEQYFGIRHFVPTSIDRYFSQGTTRPVYTDYTSANTRQLTVTEVKELLLSLDYMREQLKLVEKL